MLAAKTIQNISTRHLNFAETGRAEPNREMVLRLAEFLNIPLRGRNTCWWPRVTR